MSHLTLDLDLAHARLVRAALVRLLVTSTGSLFAADEANAKALLATLDAHLRAVEPPPPQTALVLRLPRRTAPGGAR